jgi:hypothetical protein
MNGLAELTNRAKKIQQAAFTISKCPIFKGNYLSPQ